MNLLITVNVWFFLSLCLAFLVIGLIVGGRNGRDRVRY